MTFAGIDSSWKTNAVDSCFVSSTVWMLYAAFDAALWYYLLFTCTNQYQFSPGRWLDYAGFHAKQNLIYGQITMQYLPILVPQSHGVSHDDFALVLFEQNPCSLIQPYILDGFTEIFLDRISTLLNYTIF